ncbi:MAG: T9SS type A sorting domain-containing protein [Bacteroidetes bacterium]|nr:T9SS type A sorting domain-containing protein [Bacteroidota bacterium]
MEARIAISTNLTGEKTALVTSYLSVNPDSLNETQSLSLTRVTMIKDFELSQNYPNPFNPTTVIDYTIPKDAHVTLKIYDVLGREVETLINENEQVGRYRVNFDGARLASGVYFYRLAAGSHVITKKMLLLK